MARQLTIRNLPDDVARRLDRLSRDRGTSVNAIVVGMITEAVGVDGRRARLERYATWSDEDAARFDAAIAGQRVIDADLWR